LLRILRYPNAEARQVARAAEIYEITLANVRKHVLSGMKLNLTGNGETFISNFYLIFFTLS
jgi:peroxidase